MNFKIFLVLVILTEMNTYKPLSHCMESTHVLLGKNFYLYFLG